MNSPTQQKHHDLLKLYNEHKSRIQETQVIELIAFGYLIQTYYEDDSGKKQPFDLILTAKGKKLLFGN
jgi:phage regulator Rha-like protein